MSADLPAWPKRCFRPSSLMTPRRSSRPAPVDARPTSIHPLDPYAEGAWPQGGGLRGRIEGIAEGEGVRPRVGDVVEIGGETPAAAAELGREPRDAITAHAALRTAGEG